MEPKTFEAIAIPREMWNILMAKVENIETMVESRLRNEFDNEYVDLEGARKILQYGTRKIEQFRKAGLPYYQWEPGGKIFYKRSNLKEWVERCRRVDSVPVDEPIDLEMEKLPFADENAPQEAGNDEAGQD